MAHTTVTADDVRAARKSGRHLILDVLPPEHFQDRHIPGADNACVYEVTFLDQVARLAPDKDKPIIVYGAGEGSLDAATAAGKLRRAGYRDIALLPGGIAEWLEAGLALEGDRPGETAAAHPELELRATRYTALPDESAITWTGRNYNSRHTGTLALREGTLLCADDSLKGIFTLDMQSISNSDLAGSDLQHVLEEHLKSDDFFFAAHFPVCTVEITDMALVPNAAATTPNYRVKAVMTLRGIAKELNFEAHLRPLEEGKVVLLANFDLDRTLWGVLYGSARFFKHLSYHIVLDTISVDLRIVLQ